MARYGMAIDTRLCVGCMDCVVACKTENRVPEGFNRDWIAYETVGTFPTLHQEIRSERCNHCDNPPCVTCCPTGASHVDAFGTLVQITHEECIGCKACLASCPYDARFVHPEGYADKCTFCVAPGEGRTRPGVRVGLPDALLHLRRPRRSRQRHQPGAGVAQGASAARRGRDQAAHLLPGLRGTR